MYVPPRGCLIACRIDVIARTWPSLMLKERRRGTGIARDTVKRHRADRVASGSENIVVRNGCCTDAVV